MMKLLVVGDEKELSSFEEMVEAAKKQVKINVIQSHEAVPAVQKLQKSGGVHAAFLSHHFTAPGKEEFSDTLRELIKKSYPDVPVICWGHPKKGGKQGEHYHHILDTSDTYDVSAFVAILKKIQSGEMVSEYGGKKGKPAMGTSRASIDKGPAAGAAASPRSRGSIDLPAGGKSGGRASMEGPPSAAAEEEAAPSPRRKSVDGGLRRKSLDSKRGSIDIQGVPPMMDGMMPPMMGMGMGMPTPPMGPPSMGLGMGYMNGGMAAPMMAPPVMGAMPFAGGMAAPMMPPTMLPMGAPAMAPPMYAPQMYHPAAAAVMQATGAADSGTDLQQLNVAMANLSGPNSELIRQLAEEVVRLRKQLEEKKGSAISC